MERVEGKREGFLKKYLHTRILQIWFFYINTSQTWNITEHFLVNFKWNVVVFNCNCSVLVPVWLSSHLQQLAPAAASLHLCCDSRLVHRTAGLYRVSAGPSAADAGSIRAKKESPLTHSPAGKSIGGLKPSSHWPSVPPQASARHHWCKFQLNQEPPAASSVLSPLQPGGSGEHRPAISAGAQFKNHTHPLFWPAARHGTLPAQCGVCPAPFESGGAGNVEDLRCQCGELTFVQIHLASFSQEQQTNLKSPVLSPKRNIINFALVIPIRSAMVGNKIQIQLALTFSSWL